MRGRKRTGPELAHNATDSPVLCIVECPSGTRCNTPALRQFGLLIRLRGCCRLGETDAVRRCVEMSTRTGTISLMNSTWQ